MIGNQFGKDINKKELKLVQDYLLKMHRKNNTQIQKTQNLSLMNSIEINNKQKKSHSYRIKSSNKNTRTSPSISQHIRKLPISPPKQTSDFHKSQTITTMLSRIHQVKIQKPTLSIRQSNYPKKPSNNFFIQKNESCLLVNQQKKKPIFKFIRNNQESDVSIEFKINNQENNLLFRKTSNQIEKNQINALHVAILSNNFLQVQHLVKTINPNINTCKNESSLMLACQVGNLAIVKELIQNKANVFYKLDDKTAFSIAKEKNHQIIISYLKKFTMNINYFQIVGLVGRGSFGEVYCVEYGNQTFALKSLSKAKIEKSNLTKYVISEKNVLQKIDFPFIVKLYACFQNDFYFFFLMQYASGGDLSKLLYQVKTIPEESSKMYLCEIILAIETLHSNNIIYRDLKPSNIILDEDGHVLLVDFGLSKEDVYLAEKGGQSFCGSMAYLAPEILMGKGHGKAVDWYLLGVIFYEMLTGKPPYYANNQYQLFENIKHANLKIPQQISKRGRQLLVGLLERNPTRRLGSISDAKDIKSHPYFQDINWQSVSQKKLQIPKIPQKTELLKVQPDFLHEMINQEKMPYVQNFAYKSL